MKVVFVSSMLPSGHYSQVVTSGLSTNKKNKKIKLIVYTDKDRKNLEIKNCGQIKLVWRRSPLFLLDIISNLLKDRPDVVHLQHEMNMYGGLINAALFPALIAFIRMLGFKVVVTIHAAVRQDQIDQKFLYTFHQDKKYLKPFMVKIFFSLVFRVILFFSKIIIVHTHLTKDILISDYGASARKIHVIPIPIPNRYHYKKHTKPYFFYFGYMVRRKGLGNLINGFKKFLKANPKSKYKLVLAGGTIKGQEAAKEEILDIVRKANMTSKIDIKGFLEVEDQHKLYREAYAVVIPAILSIGSSGPLFHSNSYGKCSLATNIGHFIEEIDNGITGFLINNNKWKEAFEYVTKHPAEINRIEKNIRQKAINRSPEKTADLYYLLYTNNK